LPDTSNYVRAASIQCDTLPSPVIPEFQEMPKQEPGTKMSRALSYEFLVSDKLSSSSSSIEIKIDNTGNQGAAFVLFDVTNITNINPLKYTVGSKNTITSNVIANGDYYYHLQGPNGFVRNFQGNTNDVSCIGIESSISYQPSTSNIILNIINNDKNDKKIFIVDNAYGIFDPKFISIPSGTKSSDLHFNILKSGHWYDITVSVMTGSFSDNDNNEFCYIRRFMGRMETGFASISDPAMAMGLPGLWSEMNKDNDHHPILPLKIRKLRRINGNSIIKDGICNLPYQFNYCDN